MSSGSHEPQGRAHSIITFNETEKAQTQADWHDELVARRDCRALALIICQSNCRCCVYMDQKPYFCSKDAGRPISEKDVDKLQCKLYHNDIV